MSKRETIIYHEQCGKTKKKNGNTGIGKENGKDSKTSGEANYLFLKVFLRDN